MSGGVEVSGGAEVMLYDDGCSEAWHDPCGLEAAYCESEFGFAGLRPWGHVVPKACSTPVVDCATECEER